MTWTAALVIVSDRASTGERLDETAAALRPVIDAAGFRVEATVVVPDDREQIAAALREAASSHALVVTSGGTGVSARDVTPEATSDVLDFEVPGLGETMRRLSMDKTIHAVGSRALAGFCGTSLILNLPGRPKGALECFGFVSASLSHLLSVRRGPVDDAAHGAFDERET